MLHELKRLLLDTSTDPFSKMADDLGLPVTAADVIREREKGRRISLQSLFFSTHTPAGRLIEKPEDLYKPEVDIWLGYIAQH